MHKKGKGAGPETGAPRNVLAGDCWGIHNLLDHRAQRLASRYRKRRSLANALAALARVIGTSDIFALTPFAVMPTDADSRIATCLLRTKDKTGKTDKTPAPTSWRTCSGDWRCARCRARRRNICAICTQCMGCGDD